MEIDIHSRLSFRTSFRFPLQSKSSRHEIAWGACLVLFLPFIGWLLNMGHRIQLVHNMQRGREAWPAWTSYPKLLKAGVITFLGMAYYYAPGAIAGFLALRLHKPALYLLSIPLLLIATIAIPGYMTHYCRELDAREIFNPLRAFRRTIEAGGAYWTAWAITLSALFLSFFGLLLAGVGFFLTSVWFWQVAGFSFASVFSQEFGLMEKAESGQSAT